MEETRAFHYTDNAGHKAIASQPVWVFKAAQPPGNHPRGAYFTTLGADTVNLAKRLCIPREKTTFVFAFRGVTGLLPLPGGRGAFILYSPVDYAVGPDRQEFHGERKELAGETS